MADSVKLHKTIWREKNESGYGYRLSISPAYFGSICVVRDGREVSVRVTYKSEYDAMLAHEVIGDGAKRGENVEFVTCPDIQNVLVIEINRE